MRGSLSFKVKDWNMVVLPRSHVTPSSTMCALVRGVVDV
jgi:hypothetical protein